MRDRRTTPSHTRVEMLDTELDQILADFHTTGQATVTRQLNMRTGLRGVIDEATGGQSRQPADVAQDGLRWWEKWLVLPVCSLLSGMPMARLVHLRERGRAVRLAMATAAVVTMVGGMSVLFSAACTDPVACGVDKTTERFGPAGLESGLPRFFYSLGTADAAALSSHDRVVPFNVDSPLRYSLGTLASVRNGVVQVNGLWPGGEDIEFRRIDLDDTTVALSSDGRMLATGGADGVARLWDIRTGKTVRTLPEHGKGITAVAFSPDGRTLATGGADGVARLWDIRTGKTVRTLPEHGKGITAVAFSPDGRTLATGGADGVARLWDIRTGKTVLTLAGERVRTLPEHGKGITAVAFSPDGRTLATGGADGLIRLWNIEHGSMIRSQDVSSGGMAAVAFSTDGQVITYVTMTPRADD
ncbi:WD40 repeat domain-containing protein [Nonomuraea turcica]|uniref:WD40 repeat domain-containing protein n=1 Tax=Nonomuraea sp. G32 TaxID=3067274 RepID=UPI00273BE140|nr:WD40 repeat domain-containing protein [Nonomuraea sp. G32]MDP4511847.1 WD40 repeat domain-containing protein [Nonomuraea sp. G32]